VNDFDTIQLVTRYTNTIQQGYFINYNIVYLLLLLACCTLYIHIYIDICLRLYLRRVEASVVKINLYTRVHDIRICYFVQVGSLLLCTMYNFIIVLQLLPYHNIIMSVIFRHYIYYFKSVLRA